MCDTVVKVALLTPPGRGALATIALAGRGALKLVASRLKTASGTSLDELPLRRIAFGHWRHERSELNEEVVVTRLCQDRWEVHCHGGDAAASSIVDSLVRTGAKLVTLEQWIHETTEDPLQAEALHRLAAAETERAAGVLLDQYRGALRAELERITRCLQKSDWREAERRLLDLQGAGRLGAKLTDPWNIVVAGRPNVGKSSLVNRLLGFERTIVHGHPGTTRDRVATHTVLDGWQIQLVDTAGQRYTPDPVEAGGVALAQQATREADLVLWVDDVTDPSLGVPTELGVAERMIIWVANKSDLVSAAAASTSWIATSALTGDGLAELKQQIVARLVPSPPPAGAPVPFTARQQNAIAAALEALSDAAPQKALRQIQSLL